MDINFLGPVLAILAAIGFASSGVLARVGLQGIGTFSGTLFSLVGSLIALTIVALIWMPGALFSVPQEAWIWLVLAGTINFVLGRMFNYNAIHLIGVARSTPLFSLAPFFATALAVVFLGEQVTLLLALGTVAIVSGIVLIVTERA